jgi:hypothetical protein
MRNPERMDLGMMLVVLGIVFGTEQTIGYPLIGTGVLLSIIKGIKSRRRKDQRSSTEAR